MKQISEVKIRILDTDITMDRIVRKLFSKLVDKYTGIITRLNINI